MTTRPIYERAIGFAKAYLQREDARLGGTEDDYQGAAWELFNNRLYGPWIVDECGEDEDAQFDFVTGIVRAAEAELYG